MLIGIVSACLAVIGALLPGLSARAAALTVLVASLGVLVMAARRVARRWDSLLVIFVLFHILYGIVAPISVALGGRLPDIFATPVQISEFLRLYGMATAGVALAVAVGAAWRPSPVRLAQARPAVDVPPWVPVAIGVAATLGEVVNLVRTGGAATLIAGKAAYQSAVTDLPFTVPTQQLIAIAIATACVAFGRAQSQRTTVRWWAALIFAILPVVVEWALLGRRGPLLTAGVVFLLGMRWSMPIQRMRWRHVLLGIVVYLGMAFLHVNRAVVGRVILDGDITLLVDRLRDADRLEYAMNPSSNEFGAPLGNTSEVFLRGGATSWFQGNSYLVGLTLPIPGFLYPGQKPTQVSFAFRDRYFGSESEYGTVSGTGFSSILEAYLNFGLLGPLAVYLVVGMLLVASDQYRNHGAIGWRSVLLLAMSPALVIFHRSAFADAVIAPLVNDLLVLVPLYMVWHRRARKPLRREEV
jgi:hypothetical protein